MNSIRNLRLRQKLFMLGAAGILATILATVCALVGVSKLNLALADTGMIQAAMRSHLEADMMHDALRSDVLAALLATTPAESEAAQKDCVEHADWFRKSLSDNRGRALPAPVLQALERVGPALDAYIRNAQGLVSAAAQNRSQATAGLGEFQRAFSSLEEQMEKASNTIENEAKSVREQTASVTVMAKSIPLVICVLAGLGLFISARLIANSVTNPLQEVMDGLARLEAGDLTRTIARDSLDEMGTLAKAYNGSIAKLRALIECVQDSAERVQVASSSVSQAQQVLAQGSASTASVAAQASGASQQVSESVSAVATGAGQMVSAIQEISRSTAEAVSVAGAAQRASGDAVDTMTRLENSSQEINQSLTMIGQIAKQTNLLALNATIEASRAGEMGKGFAVVASEVRELARATSAAAEDIRNKVGAIQGDATATRRALATITSIVERIHELGSMIAAAVEEQNASSSEIGRNMTEVAQGSAAMAGHIAEVATDAQRSADNLERSRADSEELRALAQGLQEQVAVFQV